MNIKDRMIIEEFRKERPNFVALGDVVHEKLTELVKDAGIEMLGIEHRVKTENSLAGKLARKGEIPPSGRSDRYSGRPDDLLFCGRCR